MKWSDTITRAAREPNRGTNSIVEERKGFTIRTRGDTSGTIEHEYECPVHGRFRATVLRADVPSAVECSATVLLEHDPPHVQTYCLTTDMIGCTEESHRFGYYACGYRSSWCAPLVGIGWAAGEVTS